MKILLQHKIFIGYFLLMAIIGSMVAIVLHERGRVQKIEDESIAIFQTQHNINTTHRYVTTLVTYGESVMVWNDEDSLAYRERRVRTDSMLQTLRIQCKDFIQPEQIDSLRTLLAAKEDHLFQIMEATREQKKTDSLLFHQKPTVTTQTTIRTVTRKKKGIAGFFGGKETVQMPVVTTRQTAPVAARGGRRQHGSRRSVPWLTASLVIFFRRYRCSCTVLGIMWQSLQRNSSKSS